MQDENFALREEALGFRDMALELRRERVVLQGALKAISTVLQNYFNFTQNFNNVLYLENRQKTSHERLLFNICTLYKYVICESYHICW